MVLLLVLSILFVLFAGLLLMVEQLTLDMVNRRHASRLQKKNDRWAVPERVYREHSREDLRRERDRVYLEENFPELEEFIIGVDDL